MKARRSIITAVTLWLVFAFLVWNVIFDRMIVLAGRRYSHDAAMLYRTTHRYLLIDDVMRPAVARGVVVASVSAASIAIVALVLIRFAAVRDSRQGESGVAADR